MNEKIFPAVKIFVASGFDETRVLAETINGLEEEGVPYEMDYGHNGGCVDMAYKAAEKSVLEVGIGIDRSGGLAVHYRKLPKGKPLFRIDYSDDKESIRNVAANAARLVRGIPFN